ncbi:glycoside hydrolase family 2 TIM barrel-domain containing protein [Glycomyces sp. YM15]|uniref:glycoside hydrolase family 2 protein n=1 Tax=Glycomyces sp. YM15 TaxID=2800446 RepID=UPI001962876C|nr:glycoside hydrolase family 2 TIM barrel-domain containing protein [Glycomyces sp. YM15]
MFREQRFINDDWTFAYGEHPRAEGEPPSPDWYDVGLPHSFDLPDFREQRFYVGHGCYRRTVDVDETWLGRWIALEFLGVFQVAEVFVNGRFVDRHEGGYTPFTVDISDAVVEGPNDVFVRVNNLWNPRLAPRAGDYSFNGGIYRDVSLIVADRVRIDWYGIGVTTPEVSRERATVAASVEIVNDEPRPVRVNVAAVVADPSRTVASLAPVNRMIPARSRAVIELEGAVGHPLLWHPDQPHRYKLTASVSVDGVARDSQTTHFGFRWFEFTADRGFFLNGEHLDLHGANVHQNRGGWGEAGTRAGIRRDIALVKSMGMNMIRGSHYPHHPYFAEECDRQGVLFWSELHFWGMGGENIEGFWFASAYPVDEADEPEFEESLRRALREMIRTHRNHPSIVTWSIGNEAFFSADLVVDKAKALTVELVALAKELDPTRPVAVGGAQRKGFDVLGDIAGYNGDGAELFIDPGIPSVVSEYHGVRGRGPGEYEVEWEHGVEVDYPWRSGKLFWCAFHYKSIADGAGLQGLIDYFRVPRRPYHWYRERLLGIAPPKFPEPGEAVALRLRSDVREIPTDGTGDAQLWVELVDVHGERVADDRPVRLTVLEGEGIFPSGPSITLGPETDSMNDGAAAIELRSYAPGRQRIRATADGLEPAEITLVAVGPPRPPRLRKLAPPAPYVTEPPVGQGDTSLVAYRPVAVSSALPRHEGGNATLTGSGTYWRAASREPGEWLKALLEFPYEITRIEVVFAEPPTQPWTVETSKDGRNFDELHCAGADGESPAVYLDFPSRTASAVRLSFPQRPIDVEEIRVY